MLSSQVSVASTLSGLSPFKIEGWPVYISSSSTPQLRGWRKFLCQSDRYQVDD